MTVTKPTPDQAGCWVEGHWGQYGVARMIEIAAEHGYRDPATEMPFAQPDIVEIAARKLAAMSSAAAEDITDAEEEMLLWTVGDVEGWLNANVAPEGYAFGWSDGEFFLSSTANWEEEA